jgi:hypothetical protein
MTSDHRDNPEYWNRLADRVTAAALRPTAGPLQWLAESPAAWVATLTVASVVFAFLTVSTSQAPVDSPAGAVATLPSDAVGHMMADSAQPPAIGTLLFAASVQGQR